MATLADFTPDIEYYSIDEAFLALTPTRQQTLTELGRAIQQRVKRTVGIPVSVGIAETKTLAKIATYHAKRSPAKTQGVLDLTASPYQELALEKTPVAEVWGVGSRYAEMLGRHRIQTALDLRNAPDDFIRQQMSVVGLRTVHELRGIRCLPLELVSATRKSITVSRSFGSAVATIEDLRAALALYVSRAAEKLRKEELVAGTLTTFIETNRFQPPPQYNGALTLDIAPFSNLTPELQALTWQALAAIYQPGYQYKRAGVLLTNLVPAQTVTRRLWEDERNEQLRQVMSAMDAINTKFGRDTVRWGAFARQGLWPTKFGQRSPRYTTRWDELMTVR